jgi:NAD(P)-dependent dehydrogenase (short-subunit alcohol dehydrogenase family)
MSTRTVLITGGTSGLGFQAAAAIARDPSWHVLITGKDPASAASAGASIGAEYAADEHPPLQALVCNAGVQHINGIATSRDGYEATFAVNHLGHFLLANLLIDQMRSGGRVIVVSSDTHDPAQKTGMPAPRYTRALELAAPDSDWAGDDSPGTAGRRRYTTSKLCNVLFTYEAARRWRDRGITVNAFNPGLMPGTGLARDYPRYQQLAWRYLMPALTFVRPGVNSPRTSGLALARLATDAGLGSRTGTYWSGNDPVESSSQSYDANLASELWEASVTLSQP